MSMDNLTTFIKDNLSLLVLLFFILPEFFGDSERIAKYIKGGKNILIWCINIIITILSALFLVGTLIKFLIKNSYKRQQLQLSKNINLLTDIKHHQHVMQECIFNTAQKIFLRVFLMSICLFIYTMSKDTIFEILSLPLIKLNIENSHEQNVLIINILFIILALIVIPIKTQLMNLKNLLKQTYDIDNSILTQRKKISELENKIKKLTKSDPI